MADPTLDDILDRLYSAPLAEFVKLRNEAARALRTEGRKDDAAEVKALRKPSMSAWVVNQLHYRSREHLEGFVEANRTVRDAHGGSGPGLQQAVQERRRRLDHLIDEARMILIDSGGAATREQMRRITGTLEAATAAGSTQPPGRLTEDLEAAGFGALAGLTIAPPPPGPEKAGPKGASAPRARTAKRKPKPSPPLPPKETGSKAERATLQVEQMKLERSEREVTRAETEHLAALRRVDRARAKIDELEERLGAARSALETARSNGKAKATELEDAKQALKRARKRVEAARERVDLAERTSTE